MREEPDDVITVRLSHFRCRLELQRFFEGEEGVLPASQVKL